MKNQPQISVVNQVVRVDNEGKRVSDKDFEDILTCLAHMKTGQELKSVYLNNAGLDNGKTKILGFALENITASLEVLDIGCNNIWKEGFTPLAKLLSAPSTCSVLELNINDSHLGDGSCAVLAQHLKENTTLTSLSVDQNAISDVGVEVLLASLVQNTTLISLSLRQNNISDVGAAIISNMLAGLGMVIGEEFVDDEEGEAEASSESARKAKAKKGGKEQKSEEQLEKEKKANEEREKRRKQAEERKAISLQKNQSLVHLYLEDNQIAVEGLKALANGVNGHKTLLTLEVDELDERTFPGAKKCRQQIQKELKENQRLRVAVIQKAFLLGLHPRVGCCSGIRSLITTPQQPSFNVRILDPVWEFLGPV